MFMMPSSRRCRIESSVFMHVENKLFKFWRRFAYTQSRKSTRIPHGDACVPLKWFYFDLIWLPSSLNQIRMTPRAHLHTITQCLPYLFVSELSRVIVLRRSHFSSSFVGKVFSFASSFWLVRVLLFRNTILTACADVNNQNFSCTVYQPIFPHLLSACGKHLHFCICSNNKIWWGSIWELEWRNSVPFATRSQCACWQRIIRSICASDLNCKLFTPAVVPRGKTRWTDEHFE